MSKKTRLEKRSSFRKGGMVALMGMSLFPFNPQLASATLFNDPTAADSAFAAVPGRTKATKNDTYGKSGSATLGAKGQKRIGSAALTGIRNDVSNMVTNVTNDVTTRLENNNIEITQRVQNDIIASQREVISTVQASLGDSAPIIHEFTTTTSRQFVQNMPYDGFVVMTVVGGGSGGNSGYNHIAGYGGNAGQFINEQKVAVAKGQPIYVTVGAGGAGASAYTLNPQAGGGSQVLIGAAAYTAAGGAAQVSPRQAACPPRATGIVYHTNNPGDAGSGCSGGFGAVPVDGTNEPFSKAVAGTGGGATRGRFYWRSGTMSLLSGQLDAKFGAGGAGGAPALLFVPSRGFSQDPINGDGGPGGYSTPGSKGGDGYVKLKIYDPNALLTTERFADMVNQGKASNNAVNWEKIIAADSAPLSVPRSWFFHGTRNYNYSAQFKAASDNIYVTASGDSSGVGNYYSEFNTTSGFGQKIIPQDGSMPYLIYKMHRSDQTVSFPPSCSGGNAVYNVGYSVIKASPQFSSGEISSVTLSQSIYLTGAQYSQYAYNSSGCSSGDGD